MSKVPRFKHNDHVTVCYYTKFEPMIYGDDDAKGFEADLLRAIFKLWQVKAEFHPIEDYKNVWKKPGEKNSIYDIAAAGIDPHSRTNINGVKYSRPTAKYSHSLLIKRKYYDDKTITSLKSFDKPHLKIGVIGDTTGEIYCRERIKKHHLNPNLIQQFETEDDMLHALERDEIYAIARGSIGNEYQELQRPEFKTIEQESFGEEVAFAVDPENPGLLKSLNDAIKVITQDGKLSYSQWQENNRIFDNPSS